MPVCGAPMAINLRCDMTFVQDDGWYAASNRYDDFIRRHQNLHILFWSWAWVPTPRLSSKILLEDDFPESESGETSKMLSKSYCRILTQNIKRAVIRYFLRTVGKQFRWCTNQCQRQKKVLEYARLHGAVTRNDIIGLLGVSSSTAVRILKKLVKSNLLKQNGRARSTRYTIVKQ